MKKCEGEGVAPSDGTRPFGCALHGLSNPYSSGYSPSGPTGAYDWSRQRGQRWFLRVAQGLMAAHRAADGETAVVVAVNQEREARRLHLEVDGREGAAAWPPSVTSASKDLAPIPEAPSGDTLSVPARSIVTYVESGS